MEEEDVEENTKNEPYFMRMTPMEVDIQLQAAELVFRSLLEGKRLPVSDHPDIESWEKDVLGPKWCEANELQRKEVVQQVGEDGENTPPWSESLGHMGDISREIFDAGCRGERFRELNNIDRVEVVEQFKELHKKVSLEGPWAHHARCGAGDRLYGLRACVAMFRTFVRDPPVLKLMATTLSWIITHHDRNRDSLACITVPAPPMERSKTSKDRGWSFLRNALDAFVVQAGGARYGELANEGWPAHTTSRQAALAIADCILAARNAPAAKVQVVIAQEDAPEDAWIERKELRVIIPRALEKCDDLIKTHENPEEAIYWQELKKMLSRKPPQASSPR